MKFFYLTSIIATFLLIFSNGIMAQTPEANAEQLKLMEQFVGTWQEVSSNDSITLWEVQLYSRAFVSTGYHVYGGKKSFWYTNNWGFIPKEGKFKGHVLYAGGGYLTWIASFTSDKKMSLSVVRDFNPEAVVGTIELVFENPASLLTTHFNLKGVKTGEAKYFKIK